MRQYILSIDAGTTSSRAIIFDRRGTQIAVSQFEFTQIFPQKAWVEHDAVEIWETQLKAVKEVMEKAGIGPDEISAVGITNQRETTVVWDKNTGKPYHNAVVWMDTRNDRIVAEMAKDGGQDRFRPQVGLPLATYFSGLKVKWLLDNVPEIRAAADAGDALFGNVDTWLIWNLTGGVNGGAHVTDVTNASRTMLMNLDTLSWNEEIAKAMGIPMSMLPTIKSSSEVYGYTLDNGPFGGRIPVAGDLGDQQAATVGQACFSPGEAKNTYGTGCFMILNTGEEPVPSKNGLLTTLCYKFGDQPAVYDLDAA